MEIVIAEGLDFPFFSTDINECLSNHDCTVGCENTRGSYKCSCGDGYKLAGDGTTCVGQWNLPVCLYVYWMQAISLNFQPDAHLCLCHKRPNIHNYDSWQFCQTWISCFGGVSTEMLFLQQKGPFLNFTLQTPKLSH